MPMRLDKLAQQIGATLVGDGAVEVSACAPIDTARHDEVAFLANNKYLPFLQSTKAAAVIVSESVDCPQHLARLVAKDPYFAFRNAMIALHGFRAHPEPVGGVVAETAGISVQASVHESATIGEGTMIHPHAVVERSARIGPRCVLYPGSYVGQHTTLGEDCVLFPNAVIYEHCVLGNRVTIHANCVIGHDGFGYATHGGAHHKIPQAGIVVIEDDVELGAGCAIERAAMGETRIGQGTKFADLISIGHGTIIGKHCLFVSLVGVSGSVEIGDGVALGGQVGVTGHLRIGNFVQAAGRTAIVADVPDGAKVGGIPAVELDLAKRNALAGMNLYELVQRVKKLERELAQIRNTSSDR